MIGVLVPVHNEERLLGQCLRSVMIAARHHQLQESVEIVVILDNCEDDSLIIAKRLPVTCINIRARNVGLARAVGAEYLLSQGARWIACTDADSRVAPDWLVAQLALQADMVCGTVDIDDWGTVSESVRRLYEKNYHHRDGHRHIHGANLGFDGRTYRLSGGFPACTNHEDVQLVRRFERMDARIAWSCRPRVVTSSRLCGRAKEGFAHYLHSITRQVDSRYSG